MITPAPSSQWIQEREGPLRLFHSADFADGVRARALSTLRYLRPAPLARFARLRHPDTPEGNLALAVAVARILAAPGRPVSEDDVRESVAEEAAHQVTSFRDDKAQSRQIGAKWSGGPLAGIAAPTLVLHGQGDPLLRVKAAHDIAAAIPGSRLRTLPGVGHPLPRDAWTSYADELRALADQSREQPRSSDRARQPR